MLFWRFPSTSVSCLSFSIPYSHGFLASLLSAFIHIPRWPLSPASCTTSCFPRSTSIHAHPHPTQPSATLSPHLLPPRLFISIPHLLLHLPHAVTLIASSRTSAPHSASPLSSLPPPSSHPRPHSASFLFGSHLSPSSPPSHPSPTCCCSSLAVVALVCGSFCRLG